MTSKSIPNTKNLTPGTKTPVSGQYRNTKTGKEVTSIKDKPLPPGPKGVDTTYDLVDRTKH